MRAPVLTAFVLLLLLGIVRGGNITISKFVSTSGVAPLGYVFWQCTIAAVVLLGLRAARGHHLPRTAPYLRYYVVIAVLGSVIPNTVFFYAVKTVPAGTMAVILTTVPFITYAIVLALRMERRDALRAAGIAVGFAGAVLITWPQPGGVGAPDWRLLLAFLCPAAYALAGVLASRLALPHKDSMLLAGGTLLVSGAIALPLALGAGQFHPLWQSPGLPEALIVAHGVLAAVAYYLFFVLVQSAGPVFHAQSTYVIALTGIGWGMLVFGETHGARFWLATACILAGLWLVNHRQQAARSDADTAARL